MENISICNMCQTTSLTFQKHMQGRSIFLELFFATFRTESVFLDNKGFSFRSLLQLSVVDSLFSLRCL